MKLKLVCTILLIATLLCTITSCDKTASQGKKFVVGEEILFNEGKPFTLVRYVSKYGYDENWNYVLLEEKNEQFTITSAKLVAMEELSLDDSSNWPIKDKYLFSYRYRMYVTGYAPIEYAGEGFIYTLRFRTVPYNGVEYYPIYNRESSVVGNDGYFEYSVDVYMPDVVTRVLPVDIIDW